MNLDTLQRTLTTQNHNLSRRNKGKQEITVLYVRLSQDDGTQGDSDSITNQKAMLEKFAREKKLYNTRFFVDDGYTGTNFNRPGFQEALELVNNGEVKNFVVKDLSRFGRNYAEVALYTEILFPKLDIRFIAVNDGVDSETQDSNEIDFAPFRNVFNEFYAKDTSKKIRAVKRAKGLAGERISANAPFGYKKDPNDKNHLLVDEPAAKVVKKIFNYCIDGFGPLQIAKKLEKERVPTTTEYKNKSENPTCVWHSKAIVWILERPDYLGHTVNFKTTTKSYRDKRKIWNDPKDWAVFKNTHEPIIDQETFDLVQKMRQKRRRQTKADRVGLFSGLVYCADCKNRHYFCTGKSVSPNQERYVCSGFQSRFIDCNNAHYIREMKLAEIVLNDVNDKINFLKQHEKQFTKSLAKRAKTDQQKELKKAEKRVIEAKKRVSELDNIIKRLYEDNVLGKLSDERFTILSKDYEFEQSELKQEIDELEIRLSKQKEDVKNVQKFLEIVRKYTTLESLTPSIVNELIDRIEIHKPDKSTGKRIQQIDIYYRFVGKLDEI
ncbi:DUF4368 domain-containing protein [Enterococcus faecalis]|uniref:DUF4368 domain-containing protein n=1 Tax=Enterococcus faecalis TaxID=1351 RepID=A0AAP6RHX4_ENTFL|nr:recombinase family protein [Enterococcus faecalis]MXS29387.1 DUF4368 domain-containing protein [Enterococcus faecalis]MXS52576.1 DUF4368 domain-containing protein [Enterococcus faecalis]